MAFVKLDCGILDSTIWGDREAREVFITALLMAKPRQLFVEMPQLCVNSLEMTGFVVPPGWYGFVEAAGPGIVDRCKIEREAGMAALERLGSPEADSRTPDYGGRRLVRVDGGYVILNYAKYRAKDHTAALRSKRYRIKKKNAGKSARQIRTEAAGREARFVKALELGNEQGAERIAVEDLPE